VVFLQESGRPSWATLTRTIQVLEGNKDSLNTCNLIFGAIPSREAERRDAGVIDDLPSIEVEVQRSDNLLASRRACARDSDGKAIGAIDSTITVTD